MKCTAILEICALNLITVFIDYIQTQIRVTNIPLYMEADVFLFFLNLKIQESIFMNLFFQLCSLTSFAINFGESQSKYIFKWTHQFQLACALLFKDQ